MIGQKFLREVEFTRDLMMCKKQKKHLLCAAHLTYNPTVPTRLVKILPENTEQKTTHNQIGGE